VSTTSFGKVPDLLDHVGSSALAVRVGTSRGRYDVDPALMSDPISTGILHRRFDGCCLLLLTRG